MNNRKLHQQQNKYKYKVDYQRLDMINYNPYNLPDKVLKTNLISKPITLQSKKSRDRSYDYSKQISATTNINKGIKIQSQMKKSLTLQHITSSPNLHTPSTSSSTNCPNIEFMNRSMLPINSNSGIDYHSQAVLSPLSAQQVFEPFQKKFKFLFQKFYQINEQLASHDNILTRLAQKQSDFNSGIRNQKDFKQKDQISSKSRSFHNGSYQQNNLQTITNQSQAQSMSKAIELIKKQMYHMKQQIITIKNNSVHTTSKQTIETGNSSNSGSVNLKFNSPSNQDHEALIADMERLQNNYQNGSLQQIARMNQAIDQLKAGNQQKFAKMDSHLLKTENGLQLIGHKVNKNQEKLQNLQSNIEKHMNLVNQQINAALSKIVASINDKISKALEKNLSSINQKLRKHIQTCKALIEQQKGQYQQLGAAKELLLRSKVQGKVVLSNSLPLHISGFKSELKSVKVHLKTTMQPVMQPRLSKKSCSSSNTSESDCKISLLDGIYLMDKQGYLLDENHFYLLDQNNMMLRLEQANLNKLKQLGFEL